LMGKAAVAVAQGAPVGRVNVTDLVSGTEVDELFVVTDLKLRAGGKAGHYVTFRLADATGNARGVFWPAESGEAESFVAGMEDGAVARVKGDVVSFGGRVEVRVSAPRGGISPWRGKPVDPELFVAASAVSERELRDAVEVRIGLIGDRHLRRSLRAFFADKERTAAYFESPARLEGSHSYVRGLAEEAVEVARVAGAAAASIPGVDRDLVTAGAILAPAGAILAFERNGLRYWWTALGRSLPLAVLSADLVVKAAREAGDIPAEVVARWRHVILGEREVPEFNVSGGEVLLSPEAVVLHHVLAMSRMVSVVAKVASAGVVWGPDAERDSGEE
jgi:3'-5' exoribonuclease